MPDVLLLLSPDFCILSSASYHFFVAFSVPVLSLP